MLWATNTTSHAILHGRWCWILLIMIELLCLILAVLFWQGSPKGGLSTHSVVLIFHIWLPLARTTAALWGEHPSGYLVFSSSLQFLSEMSTLMSSLLKGHCRNCKYRPVRCPNLGCSELMPTETLDTHVMVDCPFRKVFCNHCRKETAANWLEVSGDYCHQ